MNTRHCSEDNASYLSLNPFLMQTVSARLPPHTSHTYQGRLHVGIDMVGISGWTLSVRVFSLSTLKSQTKSKQKKERESLLFHDLEIATVILERVPTCDSAHSCWLYSAAPSRTCTMIGYSTESHYPDTEPTRSCTILITPSAWLRRDKSQLISHCFDSTEEQTPRLPHMMSTLYWSSHCSCSLF